MHYALLYIPKIMTGNIEWTAAILYREYILYSVALYDQSCMFISTQIMKSTEVINPRRSTFDGQTYMSAPTN